MRRWQSLLAQVILFWCSPQIHAQLAQELPSTPSEPSSMVPLALANKIAKFLVGDDSYRNVIILQHSRDEVEQAVITAITPPESTLMQWVTAMGDPAFSVREDATHRVAALTRTSLPILQRILARMDDPEIRPRLNAAIESIDRNESKFARRADDLLRALQDLTSYADHLRDLKNNPNDPRPATFFRVASFEQVWPWLAQREAEDQLRYLLLLIHFGPSKEAAKRLSAFDGYSLLRVAAQTYWPVELQKPKRDGAYLWTFRAAAIDHNTAQDVLKISLNPASGQEGKRGAWVHFERYDKIIYLWRNERPYLEIYQGIGLGAGYTSYSSLHGEVSNGEGVGCMLLTHIPSACDVPVVRISEKECEDWGIGKTYDWAKELFPPEYRNRMRWTTSKHQPSTTILTRPDVRREAGTRRN